MYTSYNFAREFTTGAKDVRSACLPGVTTLFWIDIDDPNSDVIDKEKEAVAG